MKKNLGNTPIVAPLPVLIVATSTRESFYAIADSTALPSS